MSSTRVKLTVENKGIEIKQYLINNGYIITYEEYKIYGSYFRAKKKYSKCKEIELIISNIKDKETIYVNIKEKYYNGNCSGYVDKIEDIEPIVEFITKEK